MRESRVGASTYMRDLEVMAPEMEKQKELLAEFARNNADLELEYKVRDTALRPRECAVDRTFSRYR